MLTELPHRQFLNNQQKSEVTDSRGPLCFLSSGTEQQLKYCETIELSLLLFIGLSICFLYQIVFVWHMSFRYAFVNEKRMQIMGACVLYCILSAVFMFLSVGLGSVVLESVLDFLQYQITVLTMIYYFHKITSILPTVEKRWSKILRCSYLLQSFALLLIVIGAIIWKSLQKLSNDEFNCVEVDFIVFQGMILLSFASLVVLTCLLRCKIDQIHIISKIDMKITFQYSRTVNKLAIAIFFISALRLTRTIVRVLAFNFSGSCFFEIEDNKAANNAVYFFTGPLFNLLLITPFLCLFWRQRLTQEAQASIMAMNRANSSFIRSSYTKQSYTKQSKLTAASSFIGKKLGRSGTHGKMVNEVRSSQTLFEQINIRDSRKSVQRGETESQIMPTGGIFMDMSQGDIILTNNEASESDSSENSKPGRHLQNLEDFERDALQEETASLPVNSLPAELMLKMQQSSATKYNEFGYSPESQGCLGSSLDHFGATKQERICSLNGENLFNMRPDDIENGVKNIKANPLNPKMRKKLSSGKTSANNENVEPNTAIRSESQHSRANIIKQWSMEV